MVNIVLTFVMDSSNNRSISNGRNNSFNIMVSASSNTESGMASYLVQLGQMTSLLQCVEEEAYLLSPNQCASTISTEVQPLLLLPKRPTEHQGLHGRASELRIVAYVFGLSVFTVRSNASEQRDDGSSSRNVVNQMSATLVSIDNVNQGHGGSSNPRQIGQNYNPLPFVHLLTSIDTFYEQTIELSSTLVEPNRATVVNNVHNNKSEHDRMRMDIDNLSYETLNEEIFCNPLKRNKYRVNKYMGTPERQKYCCICQDEFVNCQEIGKLDYRHNYHVACIEK
ncbi:hypothetical protein M9H77_26038 [Catharanthus roseus]|uniref:Uncharacterized protein n=1 Tax=Catharanthus roseus TaxID=4058 RepID=A0ACC0AAE5_CATRO|nr:hypothetical protein M9H77_26038 [Catharanthus roseus]